jgi:chromosome segregation ATPase
MAVYSYLRPAIAGRRILEVGCDSGESAALLVKLGARSVIAAGSSWEVAEARKRYHEGALGFVTMADGRVDAAGPFDVILLPEAGPALHGEAGIHLAVLHSLLTPEGRLACIVENGDHGEGVGHVGYYELVDLLTPFFRKVRMFGQTPFMGIGVAEFDENAADLRVESDLISSEEETPSHYIALAGPDEPLNLGYALVQIPQATHDLSFPVGPGGGTKAPDSALLELRQRLAEAEGRAEGLVRVSRAQNEEIEELRARVRRTSEARAELDEEVRRLRRSLIEADESVVNLSRKTAQEITALAQRLTSGLRMDEAARPTDEIKRFETVLAERESALAERDDRVAQLELSRQEAEWRLSAAEVELTLARSQLLTLQREKDDALAALRQQLDKVEQDARDDAESLKAARVRLEEQAELLRQRERSMDDFRKAAALHLEELGRLRDASQEQSSRVTELEDELAESTRRLAAAVTLGEQTRQALAEIEESDRHRRSRLAELEGRMLRMEYADAARVEAAAEEEQAQTVLESQVQALKAQLSFFQSLVPEMEQLRTELDAAKGFASEAEQLRAELDVAKTAAADLEQLRTQHATLQASHVELGQLQERVATLTADSAHLRETANEVGGLRLRLEAALSELEKLREQRALAESTQSSSERAIAEKELVISELNAQIAKFQEKEHRLAELRVEIPDPEEAYDRLYDREMQYQAATMAAARVPILEARVAELENLIARRG